MQAKANKFSALVAFILLFLSGCSIEDSRDKNLTPNVILIVSYDQGWGDLSIHGNENIRTPNIDSLAYQGASLTNFYVSPVCSPTRAELLTGRYHPKSGVYATSAGGERMDLDETTLEEVFKREGYATGIFG